MLTKTLKFDNDVLGVLKVMQWSADGLRGVLVGQLDRKLYERTNKALEAMGGKWNRSAKAHVFSTDPRPRVDGLLENGSLTVERDGFFETPPAVVARMLEYADFLPGVRALEPSAGMGAIAKKLREKGAQVVCVEKNEKRAMELQVMGFNTICRDFLEFKPNESLSPTYYDVIVMNPPFEEGQDVTHIRHAYSLLRNGGKLVSVTSESPFFRSDKKSVSFREWLDEVGGDSEQLPDSSFKESGTDVRARLVIITR